MDDGKEIMDEQKYIEQIINETGYKPTKEQLNFLNAMDELTRQEILLNLRNAYTSYGKMQPLPELLKSYGADEKFIKTAQKEIAEWYFNNLGKIGESAVKLDDFEMNYVHKFSLDKLKELGLSDIEVEDAFKTDDHFKTGMAFTDPQMRTDLDNILKKNIGFSIFEIEDALNKAPDTAKGLDPVEDFNVAEQAFDDAEAARAGREPSLEEVERYERAGIPDIDDFDKEIEKLTQEQIDNYYQKGITDGLSDEQRAYLYFAPDAELRAEVMGDVDAPESPYLPNARLEEQGYESGVTDRNTDVFPKDNELIIESPYLPDARLEEQGYEAGVTDRNNFPPDQMESQGPTEKDLYKNNPDRADIISDIEMNNNIPKGSISKLGLALDPISEGLEFALKGIGLGSIANWWIRAEAANFLAGLIRGASAGSAVAQLGQSQALMGKEITGDDEAILNAFKTNLGQQMKLSPSLWLENKYSESSLGKGKTPTEQTFGWVKNMFGASE